MPRDTLIGALLLATIAGAAAPRVIARAAEKAAPGVAPAANVQVLPAVLTPEPIRDGAIRIQLVALNQGPERARLWFRPALLDASGEPATLTATGMWRSGTEDWIEPGEVVRFTLLLHPNGYGYGSWWDGRLPLRGHVAIESTTERGPDIKTKKVDLRELSVPQVQPAALELAVVFIAVASLALLLLAHRFSTEGPPTGVGSWSADSIGANVAIGAGLVTGLSAITSLPQLTIYASRPTYGIAIAVFAAVVALASPVANLMGKVCPKAALLTAATLVLWGAAGQFLIVLLLILELLHVAVIGNALAATLGTLDVSLGLGVVAYLCNAVAHPGKRKAADLGGTAGATRTVASGSGWIIP